MDRFDPNTETFKSLRIDAEGSSDPTVQVINITQDRAGILWLATTDGLHRLDPGTGKVVRYGHDPDDPSTLSSNRIRSSREDKEADSGSVRPEDWTGSIGIREGHVAFGITGQCEFGVLEDSAGVFWITYPSWQRAGRAGPSDEQNHSLPVARTGTLQHVPGRCGFDDGGPGRKSLVGTMSDGLLKLDRERRRWFGTGTIPENRTAWLRIVSRFFVRTAKEIFGPVYLRPALVFWFGKATVRDVVAGVR